MTTTTTTLTATEEIPLGQVEHVQHLASKAVDSADQSGSRQLEAFDIVEHTVPTAEAQPAYPTGTKFWLIILTLAAILVLGGLDVNIVATAVPTITDEFQTVADVGWYVGAFRLCSCAMQFAFGKAYSLFSIKRVFIIANLIFLLGSLLCATSVTSAMFVVGRALTGVGFAGLIGGFFVILTHTLPLHKRPFYCGLLGGVESVAIIAAPILGGVLVETIGWRWCFWINLPSGGATLLLMIFLFSDPPIGNTELSFKQKLKRLDLVSNLIFIPAITSLFVGLSWAGTKYPWSSGKVVGPLVTFAVLILIFGYNQYRRGDSAALPLRLLKNRSIVAGAIFTLCTNSATQVLEYYLPTYYQVVRGYGPARSGYMMVPIVVGTTLGMFLCGSGTSKLGYYTPFMLLSSTAQAAFAGLITTFNVDTSIAKLIVLTGAWGFATGAGFNAPMSAVQTVLPEADIPLGVAIVLFAQNFGPAVFNVVAQVVLTNSLLAHLKGTGAGVGSSSVENDGLTSIVTIAAPEQRTTVIAGIDVSIQQVWYLVVGLACATMVGSATMQWRSVKQKRA